MNDMNSRSITYGRRQLSELELDQVRTEVRDEIEELKLGKYQFKPQTRCRICVNDDDRTLVDKLLASGLTYAHLLRVIQPLNKARKHNNKITYNVVYVHAKECFPQNKTAQAVYRSILEKRAEEYGQDFVKGTTSIVNAFSYLETMAQKGYEQLTSEDTVVTPKEGMDAVVKLHELTKDSDSEEKLRRIMSQFNGLISAVGDFVDPETLEKILKRVQQSVSGPEEEILDAEIDEEEVFEPLVEEKLEIGGSH